MSASELREQQLSILAIYKEKLVSAAHLAALGADPG
jgi:hypothetical protein